MRSWINDTRRTVIAICYEAQNTTVTSLRRILGAIPVTNSQSCVNETIHLTTMFISLSGM
jgi:hypothetical protein